MVYSCCLVVELQDAELLLTAVKRMVDENVTHWQSKSYQDVEVAIAMLYQLAEALPVFRLRYSVKYVCLRMFVGLVWAIQYIQYLRNQELLCVFNYESNSRFVPR